MAQKRGTRLGCNDCNEINYITRKNAKKPRKTKSKQILFQMPRNYSSQRGET